MRIMSEVRIDFSKLEISDLQPIKSSEAKKTRTAETSSAPKVTFEELLADSFKSVNEVQLESDRLIEKLAVGDVEDISEVVLATSRAEIAMRMLMEVRNKLVEAYQQVSRIAG
jgi:flagellar hook-basal body complex protein FliE